MLYKILLPELTSNAKDFVPYWTPAYKKLSEKLWSPIEIDLHDSDSNSCGTLSSVPEEVSPLLTIRKIKVQNKSCPRTCCPSFTSTVVNKWEKENIPPVLKAVKILLKINQKKKQLFQQWMKSSNYSYNKTIAAIRDGASVNFQDLRNKYVTSNTKKNDSTYQRIDAELKQLRKHKPVNKERIQELREELKLAKKEMKSVKNEGVHEWELKTPKEIRAEAVKDVCKAYKTMFTNFKKGNIKRAQIRYRIRKSVQQCLVIPKNYLSNHQGILQLAPTFFGEEKFISMGKRNIKKYRHLEIQHDCRLVKKHNQYWLYIPVEAAVVTSNLSWKKYSGVDPGIRTFMTTFGNGGCYEYEHNENKIKNIDKKIGRAHV